VDEPLAAHVALDALSLRMLADGAHDHGPIVARIARAPARGARPHVDGRYRAV
jgi:hypothetical protein